MSQIFIMTCEDFLKLIFHETLHISSLANI